MRSNSYTLVFVTVMTVIVALVLASMAVGLKPIHDRNEAIFNKRAILFAIETQMGEKVKDLSDDRVLSIFDENIEQYVIDFYGATIGIEAVESRGYRGGMAEHVDMKKEKKKNPENRIFPLFVYTNISGENIYIVSVRGNGLWDEIWGNIALKDDFATVVGASFDHQAETPGLGAEIKDNPGFRAQFVGKSLYDEANNYTSIIVRKGGARNTRYEVDGISGSTVTCNGVTDMLFKGLKYYQPYFATLKNLN